MKRVKLVSRVKINISKFSFLSLFLNISGSEVFLVVIDNRKRFTSVIYTNRHIK